MANGALNGRMAVRVLGFQDFIRVLMKERSSVLGSRISQIIIVHVTRPWRPLLFDKLKFQRMIVSASLPTIRAIASQNVLPCRLTD